CNPLDYGNSIKHAGLGTAAEVENLPSAGIESSIQQSIDDIRTIGKIARLFTIVIERYFLSSLKRAHKNMKEHVRSLPRSVDSKKAQGHGRNTEGLPIQIAQMFRRKLGRTVGGNRSGSAVLAHRQVVGIAVNRRRRCIDKLGELQLFGGLQQPLGRHDVVFSIAGKLSTPTGAHPRLPGQMKNVRQPAQ